MTLNSQTRSKHTKRHLITYSNADCIISDQFRTIRTNLKFLSMENKNKIFLITSPGKGEGKSTTIANLAVSIAQQNEKILLIDANLRDPTVHTIFSIPNQIGLTDIILKKTTLQESIYRTSIGKLDILTSGTTLYNPAELLGHEEMTMIFETVAETYDMVLIDSPTVLESTETRILANQCDGIVLVLKRGKTLLENVVEAKKLLELAHAKLVGTIMNEM